MEILIYIHPLAKGFFTLSFPYSVIAKTHKIENPAVYESSLCNEPFILKTVPGSISLSAHT